MTVSYKPHVALELFDFEVILGRINTVNLTGVPYKVETAYSQKAK